MLRPEDNVGTTFRRAFKRVDGVVMYIASAVFLMRGIYQWDVNGDIWPFLIAMQMIFLNGFLFIMMGLRGYPGLLSALIIAGMNVKFWMM